MKKFLALLALPAIFLLSACGATSGQVTDKTHTAGYFYYTYFPCGTNNSQMCPQMQWMPESWSIIVKQDADGKYVGESVSSGMYEKCQIGGRWERSATNDKDKGHCA